MPAQPTRPEPSPAANTLADLMRATDRLTAEVEAPRRTIATYAQQAEPRNGFHSEARLIADVDGILFRFGSVLN